MTIKSLTASIIKTSSGSKTIEVNLDGIITSVPEGKSRGKLEAKYLKPKKALARINELNLENLNDDFLIKNKLYLGANSTLAISIALKRLEAKEQGKELWQMFGLGKMPKLLVNFIEGGKHAKNNLKIQEHLLVCDSIKQAKEIWQDLKNKYPKKYGLEGGLASNFDDPIKILKQYNLLIGIDAAGAEVKDYKDLYYIEDPKEFKLIDNKLIIADDLTVTNKDLINKYKDIINGVIIKPNQIGTIKETLEAVEEARKHNLMIIVSHRGQETMDDFIADLAYGIGADMIKIGTYEQKERKAKYNRLAAIASEAKQSL